MFAVPVGLTRFCGHPRSGRKVFDAGTVSLAYSKLRYATASASVSHGDWPDLSAGALHLTQGQFAVTGLSVVNSGTTQGYPPSGSSQTSWT